MSAYSLISRLIAMDNQFGNGHKINEITEEGRRIVNGIENVCYIYEFSESEEGYGSYEKFGHYGPATESFHLFVFAENMQKRFYFYRYESYMHRRDSSDYQDVGYDANDEQLLLDELERVRLYEEEGTALGHLLAALAAQDEEEEIEDEGIGQE